MTDDLNLRALLDQEAFAEEQRRLGQVWTMVGNASDLTRDNDWFCTILGGRSIFIQRFAEGFRGFENRCAHRSYPLRTAERGNGPILCGFHHWRYNAEGAAVSIPNCQNAFGMTPKEMNKHLTRLEVECCGDLIFARFAGCEESLECFLGPAFEVLALLCASLRPTVRSTVPSKANWRLNQWISMDDYHLAAVHPKTFGRKSRYLPREVLNYSRVRTHSAYFLGANSGSMADWVAQLRNGSPSRVGYRIVHIFPDTSIAVVSFFVIRFLGLRVVMRLPLMFPIVVLQRYVPVAFDRSRTEATILRLSPNRSRRTLGAALRDIAARPFLWGVRIMTKRVQREDQEICENLQKNARQIAADPVYGAAEARVAWFNESYAEAMRLPEPPP